MGSTVSCVRLEDCLGLLKASELMDLQYSSKLAGRTIGEKAAKWPAQQIPSLSTNNDL